MTDEWEPLPPREKKRSRRHAPGPDITTPTPSTPGPAPQDEPAVQAGGESCGNAGDAPPPMRHAAPDQAHMQSVTAAVEKRATESRPDRGEGMGNDGVAGEFYEYLDHTADVQLHAWGKDLTAAFEHIIPCMSNYMTDLATVEVDPAQTQTFEVEGHDMSSLLFAWLDEFLFRFSSEAFVCKTATILAFERPAHLASEAAEAAETGQEMQGKYKIKVRAEGETFSLAKHPQGTEVKAITYSNMQIHEKEGRADLYVIIDI